MQGDKYLGGRERIWCERLIIAGILMIPSLYYSLGHYFGVHIPGYSALSSYEPTVVAITSTIEILYLGRIFLRATIRGLKECLFNVDSLVTIGTLSAYCYSLSAYLLFIISSHSLIQTPSGDLPRLYFSTVVYLYFFIVLGRYLESRVTARASKSIRRLVSLQPKRARLLTGGNETFIPSDKIAPGDHIIVEPDETIPTDGVVAAGASAVNEALITGESRSVEKTIGSKVIAGTKNGHGRLEIVASRSTNTTILARIVTAIKKARNSHTPSEDIANRLSNVLVPATIVAALIAFAIWHFGIGLDMSSSMLIFVAIIMVTCPYAIGLATPSATTMAVNIGLKHNIVLSGSDALQDLSKVDTVVLDKTGTMTIGKLTVTDVFTFSDSYSTNDILAIAASLERPSEHTLAKAILHESEDNHIEERSVDGFEVYDKLGISGLIKHRRYYLGSEEFVRKVCTENINYNQTVIKRNHETLVYLFTNQAIIGAINIMDPLKPNARRTVNDLKKMKLDVYLLSGDHADIARHTARRLGLPTSHVIAGVSPSEKADKIVELRGDGHKVAMVGDGVNDAPAIACANIGIAMGTGAEVTIDSSHVVLTTSDPYGVAEAIRLSHAAVRTQKENLFFAIFYNVISIPLASGLFTRYGIVMRPELAGLIMIMSTIAIIVNALSLKLVDLSKDKEPLSLIAPVILLILFTAFYIIAVVGLGPVGL